MSSTTTPTAVDLFDAYRRDWNAALEPCISCLIDRCPESEWPALSALLDDFHSHAPTPPYSPVQMRRQHERARPMMERVLNDPRIIAMEDQMQAAWRDKPWWRKRWIRTRSWFVFKRIGVKVRLHRWFRKQPWE